MLDGADVVFMTVGEDDALHLAAVLAQVGQIRDDVIDAQHVIFREHQAGIHHQDLTVIFVDHHILANFAQSAQGDDA